MVVLVLGYALFQSACICVSSQALTTNFVRAVGEWINPVLSQVLHQGQSFQLQWSNGGFGGKFCMEASPLAPLGCVPLVPHWGSAGPFRMGKHTSVCINFFWLHSNHLPFISEFFKIKVSNEEYFFNSKSVLKNP